MHVPLEPGITWENEIYGCQYTVIGYIQYKNTLKEVLGYNLIPRRLLPRNPNYDNLLWKDKNSSR